MTPLSDMALGAHYFAAQPVLSEAFQSFSDLPAFNPSADSTPDVFVPVDPSALVFLERGKRGRRFAFAGLADIRPSIKAASSEEVSSSAAGETDFLKTTLPLILEITTIEEALVWVRAFPPALAARLKEGTSSLHDEALITLFEPEKVNLQIWIRLLLLYETLEHDDQLLLKVAAKREKRTGRETAVVAPSIFDYNRDNEEFQRSFMAFWRAFGLEAHAEDLGVRVTFLDLLMDAGVSIDPMPRPGPKQLKKLFSSGVGVEAVSHGSVRKAREKAAKMMVYAERGLEVALDTTLADIHCWFSYQDYLRFLKETPNLSAMQLSPKQGVAILSSILDALYVPAKDNQIKGGDPLVNFKIRFRQALEAKDWRAVRHFLKEFFDRFLNDPNGHDDPMIYHDSIDIVKNWRWRRPEQVVRFMEGKVDHVMIALGSEKEGVLFEKNAQGEIEVKLAGDIPDHLKNTWETFMTSGVRLDTSDISIRSNPPDYWADAIEEEIAVQIKYWKGRRLVWTLRFLRWKWACLKFLSKLGKK
ncbi:MAG: hypothetical protein Q7T03_01720 [Deltaproteobacteria bacterium]|nr:hypothetical protein [Deltaproteobacteria bacterium]